MSSAQKTTTCPPVAARPLAEMLDSVVQAQRNDISSFCSGHLNPNNLWKPPEKAHRTWRSSMKKTPLLNEPSRIPVTEDRQTLHMKEAIADFSLSISNVLPVSDELKPGTRSYAPSQQKSHRIRFDPSPPQVPPSPPSRGTSGPDRRESEKPESILKKDKFGEILDRICVEELILPDIMLPTRAEIGPSKSDRTLSLPFDGTSPPARKSMDFKHEFISVPPKGITKKDQYLGFREFEEKILRKSETAEKHVLTGQSTVETIIKQLQKRLNKLKSPEDVGEQNFAKLRIFQDVFCQLIDRSATFGDVLKNIKVEYDTYLMSLLDENRPRRDVLRRQSEMMAVGSAVTKDNIDAEQNRLKQMEIQARDLLDRNTKLRDEAKKTREAVSKMPEIHETKRHIVLDEKKPKDQSQCLEDLRHDITKTLDKMAEIHQDIRDNHVPVSVYNHLDSSVRDCEIEIQKTKKQNEQLELAIERLIQELMDLLRIQAFGGTDLIPIERVLSIIYFLGFPTPQSA